MGFKIDFLASYDVESLTGELRRIAALTGKDTVSSRDITRFGRVNLSTIYVKFGSIGNANEAAGLAFNPVRRLSNVEVLEKLVDLWKRTLQESGRRPLKSDLKKYGMPCSSEVVKRRFGTWRNALIAANNLADRKTDLPPAVPKRARARISSHRRFQVFKRDNYECRICHRTDEPLEIDHVIPLCHGGADHPDNVQTLCWECNCGKGGNFQ